MFETVLKKFHEKFFFKKPKQTIFSYALTCFTKFILSINMGNQLVTHLQVTLNKRIRKQY